MVPPRALIGVAVAVALLAGCVRADLVDCGDGQLCPAGRACVALAENGSLVCAEPEQLAACTELAEDAPCQVEGQPPSSCQGGVCLPIACGNGLVDLGEACDDGNTVAGDNTCSADCRSAEICGNAIVDPLILVNDVPELDEQCDDGNLISGDGCSSQCTLESLRWRRRDEPPAARTGAAIVYDVRRGRLIMFGGVTPGFILDETTYEWTGSTWSRLSTLTSPPGRRGHQMVYDQARGRVVLFGGLGASDEIVFGDLWELDGNVWIPRTSVPAPTRRAGAAMAYDAARRRIVLFGGASDETGGLLNDTWEWDGTRWTEVITSAQPPARALMVSAYDPRRGRIVIAGGDDEVSSRLDSWAFDGTSWTPLPDAPRALTGGAMTVDPTQDRLLVWGGGAAGTLALAGAWTDLGQSQPGSRAGASLATDPVSNEVLLFGGATSSGLTDQTWRWNGAQWSLVTPQTPPPRQLPGIAHDPLRGALWMFGGSLAGGAMSAELFVLSREGWRDATTSGPAGRIGPGLAYDTSGHELVLFGGGIADNGLAPPETWLHDGASWRRATPPTSPSARALPAMAYDSRRRRVVLFGGVVTGNTPSFVDDTWEWDGAEWTPVPVAIHPSARAGTLTYDEARGVMVLTGGFQLPAPANDVWEYDGTAWRERQSTNPFAPRVFPAVAYEPTMRRTWFFGGGQITGGSAFGDSWSWSDAGWTQLLGPSLPGVIYSVSARYPLEPAFASFGGQFEPGVNSGEVWTLQYENVERREQCVLDIDEDGDGRAGCADEDCWARCTPLCPPGAPCDPMASRCGDGMCNPALETCRLCASDCACQPTCGDAFCDPGETLTTCPGDCTP